jgi:hypothetical protein
MNYRDPLPRRPTERMRRRYVLLPLVLTLTAVVIIIQAFDGFAEQVTHNIECLLHLLQLREGLCCICCD